jgi:membrane protein implicated in regulation of membrane protease activity
MRLFQIFTNGPEMLVFIVIGLLGLALAIASLTLGDFLEQADGAL